MFAKLNQIAGIVAMLVLILGGTFYAGARYGANQVIAAIQARLTAKAQAAAKPGTTSPMISEQAPPGPIEAQD